MNPNFILKNYFGYDNFRSGQREIISSILHFRDTLAILPTGGGKSICYQVPGLIFPGSTIVVSPLISLMKDQVDTLVKKKIPATYINSSLPPKELSFRLQNLDKYKFVYVSPERLTSPQFISHIKKVKINLVAIDEAHCISQWGHDFRPEYLKIAKFISQLKQSQHHKIVTAAFTATATQKVRQEIIQYLNLRHPQIFTKSFKRDNLTFHVTKCPNIFIQELTLFKILHKHQNQSGIIYASTRTKTEELSTFINTLKPQYNCVAYHGGLKTKTRTKIQEDFISNKIRLITATNAFGMGVDKPNIRFVIHFQIPSNLENYYQEAGRAGRDNNPAHCYLLFNPQDLKINVEFIKKSNNQTLIPTLLSKLESIINYALTTTCRNQTILQYFDEKAPGKCSNCDLCLQQKLTFSTQQKKLAQNLINLRAKLSQKLKIHPHQIMTDQIISWITLITPQNSKDFLKVPGIGHGWLNKWGKEVSGIIH